MYKLLIKSTFLFFYGNVCFGQAAQTDPGLNFPAVIFSVGNYQGKADEQSELYDGQEHINYEKTRGGSPYFGSTTWQLGSILYKGILFQNVPTKYDEVRQKVVIRSFDIQSQIELVSENVKSFTIGEHLFIHVKGAEQNGLKQGFYEQHLDGNMPVLSQTIKTVKEDVETFTTQVTSTRRIYSKTFYYVMADGTYHVITNERDLFRLFKERKKEVQKYLRNKRLRFKNEPVNMLKQAVLYFTQLTS